MQNSVNVRAGDTRALESDFGLLGGNQVFTLNQAARIVASRYVVEPNVARQGAEERNSFSNEHRHANDNETLNEPRTQEPLNRDPTVDIEVVGTTRSELRNDLSRRPGRRDARRVLFACCDSRVQFMPQSIRLARSALARSSQLGVDAARRVTICLSLCSVFQL